MLAATTLEPRRKHAKALWHVRCCWLLPALQRAAGNSHRPVAVAAVSVRYIQSVRSLNAALCQSANSQKLTVQCIRADVRQRRKNIRDNEVLFCQSQYETQQNLSSRFAPDRPPLKIMCVGGNPADDQHNPAQECIVVKLIKEKGFGAHSYNDKLRIVLEGAPKPELPNLTTTRRSSGNRNSYNLKFHSEYYTQYT